MGEQAKPLLPFLQRADEMLKADPKVAYYCRMFAVSEAGASPLHFSEQPESFPSRPLRRRRRPLSPGRHRPLLRRALEPPDVSHKKWLSQAENWTGV